MTIYATLPDLYDEINKAADRINCDDLNQAMHQGLFTAKEKNTISKYAMDVITLGIEKLNMMDVFAGDFVQRTIIHISYDIPASFASNFTGHGLAIRMNIYCNPFALCYFDGVRSHGTNFVRTDKNGQVRKLAPNEPNDFRNVACALLHECLHLIYDHQHEFEYYNNQGLGDLTNIATDGAINQVDEIESNEFMHKTTISYDSLCEIVGDDIELKRKDTSMHYFEALYQAQQNHKQSLNDFMQGLADGMNSRQQQNQQGGSQTSESTNGNGQSSQQQQNDNQANGTNQSEQQNQQGDGSQNSESADGNGQSSQQQQNDNQANGTNQSEQQNQQGDGSQNSESADGNGQSSQQQQNDNQANGTNQSEQQNQQGDGSQNSESANGNGNGQSSQQNGNQVNTNSDAYKAGYNIGRNGSNINGSHSVWKNIPKDVKDVKNDSSLTANDVNSFIVPIIKNVMQSTNSSPESLKSRGLISGKIADQIISGEATNEHRIPLKGVILRGAGKLKFSQKRTYNRINHQQSNRIDIKRGVKSLNNKNLHVFVDCSGSMSDDDINWALKEIANVAKRIKSSLTIIPFDAEVYPEYAQTIDRHGKFEFEPIGRGGTCVQPCFDYLRDIKANRNNTNMAIILTDGGLESHVDTHGLRNIVWILVNEDTDVLSVQDYDGYVAYLSQDQNYHLHKMSKRQSD